MLEKAGVEPPKTWDDVMAAAKAIKSKVGGDVYPVGFTGLSEPVLGPLETIRLHDALLTFHDDGTVTETEWPAADFIIGNPPFLGAKMMIGYMGEEYVEMAGPILREQLARAGVRLANELNALFR